jgi:PBSX family phage terminase large subunit
VSAADESSWKRVQGKSIYGLLGDECTNYPESFFNMCQSRLRGNGLLWPMFLTCNPSTPDHYIKTRFIDKEGQDPDLDIKAFHFTMDDNPALSEKYIKTLKASYSGIYYKRYILGEWCLAEGAIYDEFDQAVHVIAPFDIPYNWEFYKSIDFGYQNPFVTLFGAYDKKNNTLYIYDEYYKNRALMEDHAREIKKRDVKFVNGKEERIHWKSVDGDWDPQNYAELKKYGVYINHAIKDANKLGISRVKSMLKIQEDGKPRLFVFNTCKHLIKEFGVYHWKKNRESQNFSEEPDKKDDHTMDALKYMVSRIKKGKMGVSKTSAAALGL